MKRLSYIAAILLLSAQAVPALAAEGLPGATVRSDSGMTPAERKARLEQWCKDNPEKCREMKARAEQCKADPAKCRAEMQARREQWCKDNPEKCRELQAQRERCKADPEKCRAEMKAQIEQRFKKADSNGDGKLSRDEARKSMPAVARNFDAIDANKDGFVTMEELQAMSKARGGPRKGPGGALRPVTSTPA
jgi:hypothetical protein